MNAVNEIPTPMATSKRTWRWWHMALAILGVLFLFSAMSGSGTPKLRVSTSEAGAGFKQVEVLNSDDKPIKITGLKINDRGECGPRSQPLSSPDEPFSTVELKVGENTAWYTVCRVVRATLLTSAGSATFEFK